MKLLTFSSTNAWEARYPEGVSLWLTSPSLGLRGAFEVTEFEAVDELCFVCPGGKESSRHGCGTRDNPDVCFWVQRPASRILGSLGFECLTCSETLSQHDFVFLRWTRQKQLFLKCCPSNEQCIVCQSYIFVSGCWPVSQVKVNFLKTKSAHSLQPLTNFPGRDLCQNV